MSTANPRGFTGFVSVEPDPTDLGYHTVSYQQHGSDEWTYYNAPRS